jgi:hypothetical protein
LVDHNIIIDIDDHIAVVDSFEINEVVNMHNLIED